MSETPAQLGYAPAPSKRRKRIRQVLLIALITFVAVLGWRLRHEIYDRAELLYCQGRAIAQRPPDGQTVYDTNPSTFQALVNSRKYEDVTRPFVAARDGDQASEDRQIGGGHAAQWASSEWSRFLGIAPVTWASPAAVGPSWSPMYSPGATAFIGRLTSPAGNNRIVCIEAHETIGYGNDEPARGFVFLISSLTPASVFSRPRIVMWQNQTYDTGFDLEDHPRLLYGRVSPMDRSRIEIDAVSARTRRRAWWKLNDDDTFTSGVDVGTDQP